MRNKFGAAAMALVLSASSGCACLDSLLCCSWGHHECEEAHCYSHGYEEMHDGGHGMSGYGGDMVMPQRGPVAPSGSGTLPSPEDVPAGPRS